MNKEAVKQPIRSFPEEIIVMLPKEQPVHKPFLLNFIEKPEVCNSSLATHMTSTSVNDIIDFHDYNYYN